MAHGWNSYYHNLQPISPDPGSSRRTSDTEGTLSNYIGQEFSNSVTTHNHITNSNYCTDYYPSTDTANSSSDYAYQRYNDETRWQADEQTGKGYSQSCSKGDMPDFDTGALQSSQFQDLGFKQQCGIADKFLENYSDVSSGSDETKPSCDYLASNLLPRSKMSLPPENTSSDWISTNTGSMTYPSVSAGLMTESVMPSENDIVWAQNKIDSPGNTVDSSTGNEQSVPSCCTTAEKFDTVLVQSDYDGKPEKKIGDFAQEICSNISRSPHGDMIGGDIAERADDNSGTMSITELTTLLTDEDVFSDETVTQKKPNSENEHEVKNLDNKADKNTSSTKEEPKNEVFVKEKVFLKNEVSDSHPSHENVTSTSEDSLPSNICENAKKVKRDSSTEVMTKDNLSRDVGNSCEVVSQGTPPTENQALSNCFEASSDLHGSNTNAYLHLVNGLGGQEQTTGEIAETGNGEPSSMNDSPDKHITSKDVSQEMKMSTTSDQNTTTSSADQNYCGSSGNNEQKVGSLPEISQPVTPGSNKIGISTVPEPDAISSMTSGHNAPSAFRSMETYLQLNTSNTDVHSCSEMQCTGQRLNPNPSPLSDQDFLSEKTNAEDKLCPCDSVSENVPKPVEELKISTEETTMSDTLYGEPLSREDSSCDPDETEHDASHNIDGDDCGENEKFHSEQQQIKLGGFEQLKMVLHPVVILKKTESTDGQSSFYHCAKCSHTTLNVDGLIAHHHCSHAMDHVQFCRTCHLYQIGNEQAEKHVCSITSKQMEMSSDERQQKETKHGRHKCNRCGKRFSRILLYIQHMRTHTGKTPFKCNGCGLYFAQACSLNRHKKVPGRCKQSILTQSDTVGSRNEMPPKNNRVDKDTSTNIQDCYVKLVDIARTTQCYICGKTYPSLAKANKHLYSVHNMRSVSKSLKHFVMKTNTKMDKKHRCLLCPRVFKYSFNRNRHLRECVRFAIYNGKGKVNGNYKCPLCSATFSLPNNRYRHIKRSCLQECLNRLANKTQKSDIEPKILEKGEQQKLQPEEDQQEKVNPRPSTAIPEPRYRCSLCPAVFHHPSGKYKHKKKHELYKVSGKMIRYRKSIFSVMPKPDVSSSTKTELRKESLSSMEDTNLVMLRCNFCDRYFSSSRALKKHQFKHRGEKPFHCLECGRSFKKRCYLVCHRTVHKKKIQCTVCRKVLPSIGELIQHRNQHPDKGLLKCPECPQEFLYPAYLLRHLAVHHNKENKPDEMPSITPQQNLELKEQNQKSKSNLQCALCKDEFDDDQAFRKHSFTHIESSSNLCPFCERPFSCRPNLLRHMLQHTGKKPFSCTNCGKQFFRQMFMKLHLEKCSPKQTDATEPMKTKNPYFCSICPRSFCKKTRLKNHHIAHKKKTLLRCSNCGQCYSINRISKHLQECNETKMKGDNSPLPSVDSSMKCTPQVADIDEIPPQSNTRILLPLKCSHCPKRFRFKSVLLRHLVSHTGVQPYACAHCQRRFGSQNLCALHENLCDGISKDQLLEPENDAAEDPPSMPAIKQTADYSHVDSQTEYKCKFCTKTFTKPRSLRRHILTHNEVKPYRCKTCDGCFSRHDHLKVHQSRCKGRKRRLEICIPKISLDDVGKGWQIKFGNDHSDKNDTFDCEFCRRTFSTQSKLSRHVTMFHSTKLFKCSRCGSAFSHEKSLKKHRKVNKCRRSSMHESAATPDGTESAVESVTGHLVRLPRILSRIHPKTNKKHRFGCTYCPRVFSNGSHLAVHIRLHTGERPYSCNYCGQTFVRKDYVQRHVLKCTMKHRQSNVLCDRCDRCGSFFPADKLENHKKSCTPTSGSSSMTKWMRQSTPECPPRCFSCAYCSNRFLLFSQLQEHFMTTHKMETMEPPLLTAPLQQHLSNMPNDKEETTNESCDKRPSDVAISAKEKSSRLESKVLKEFFCFECNTSFANKAGLMGHMRTHQNVNPINCKICKKSFGNRTLLRNHYRKCKKMDMAAKQPEGPLKATLDFALNDSVLVFKEKSETTGSGVLQTNFSCKDGLFDEPSQDSRESQIQSSSNKETKEVQYQCSECEQTFTDGLMLISHLEDHGRQEQEKKRNTCTRCGRVCTNQANLEKHMKIHGISKKYACPQCSKMFFSMTELEEHKSCHDPNKKYFCKICFQRFWTRPSLCNHYSEEHVDDAYTCQFCSKTYAAKKSLARHYKKWHPMEQKECKRIGHEKSSDPQKSKVSTSGESEKEENIGDQESDSDLAPYFPCHVCGKTFTTSESLEDHQLCHLGEKPHECAECGKCFFQASQLLQHQRKHQSEFQCPTCGKGFVTRFALRKHKQGHIKIHPYRCSRCHLTFKCQSQLAEHMHTHREDNFPCDICNQVFVSKSSRAEHRKSHSVYQNCPPPPVSQAEKEPPTQVSESSLGYSAEFKYRCGVCQERFRDPEELSEHGCKAAKERPYSCTVCNKHFLHTSDLKKHRTSHLPTNSDSEYPCNQCKTTFYSTKDFLNHLNNPDDIIVEIKRESDDEGEGPIPTFICPVCHKCFPTGMELIYHFPTHPDGAYKCEKIVPPKDKVEDHGGSSRTPAVAVKCRDSGQSFSGDDAFRQRSCPRQRPTVAKTKFSEPSSSKCCEDKKKEVDVRREELYNCPACSKKFKSKDHLLEHQSIDHSDGKTFRCEICKKLFARRRYLTRHKRIHSQKEAVSHTRQPQQRVLNCRRCNASFNTKQDLSKHMRQHAENEVGEYRCDMCYKSFSLWSLLRQHQESHVGEVVYECTECDKAFAFPHLLDEHQQTHAGSSK